MSQSSNTNRIQKGSLAIDQQLYDFIENEVLPKVGVDSDDYWSGFEKVIKEFTPRNKALLEIFVAFEHTLKLRMKNFSLGRIYPEKICYLSRIFD